MPNVRVVATQVSTNVSRSAQSGATGDYLIPLLTPGAYLVTIAHPGFKTYVRDDVVLQVNQRIRLDVTLQPGVVAEKIEVRGEVPVINTENASVGKVIDTESLQLIPLNGRLNIVGLLALAPGIQNPGTQDSIPAYGITPTVSGAPSYGSVNWTIDGTRNIPPNIARGLGDWPPLEGIQEFKVITSGASAEFDTANQVVVVTRGGANRLHGTALMFNRNRFLAAKNFFVTDLPLAQYNRNEFGGNISGPIYVPGVYNGKNKSFFFFNYEGYRRNQASPSSNQVPTAAMRAGDFSELLPKQITDPYNNGQPFPGNRIPTNRLNSVSTRLLDLYFPLPNRPGTGVNLVENIPVREHVDRWSFRLDHNFSERDQLNGGLMISHLGPNQSPGRTSMEGGLDGLGDNVRNGFIAWNHSFGPQTINELRAGYLAVGVYRIPQNVDNVPIGDVIPGLGDHAINGAPQLYVTDMVNTGETGGRDRDNVGSLTDNLVLVRGNHTVKAGGHITWGHQNNVNEISPYRGRFDFSGKYTGVAVADFVLGWPIRTQRGVPGWKSTGNRDIRINGYLQDDWRISRNVTLNLGIRYEFVPQQQETHGQASMFIPGRAGNVVFGRRYPDITQQRLVTMLGIPLSADIGLPDNVADYIGNDGNNFAPRIGVAWRVGPNTVVRGGAGLYYVSLAGGLLGGLSSQAPFVSNETFEQPAGNTPTITMSNAFPSQGTLPTNPGSQFQTKFVTPYSMQWNLTVEHMLPRDTGVRVGYYGQRNVKVLGNPDLNNVGQGAGPAQPRRPYQPYSGITMSNNPMYQGASHALQAGLQKRYSGGLLVSAEYQYTRAVGTESNVDPFNYNDSRGNLSGVRKHNFASSYVYDLPIGKGRALFTDASGVVEMIVGGWQLSGILTAMSGAPFSPSFSATTQGWIAGRPDVVPGVPLYPAKRTIAQYFNPAAFARPATFTYGNAGYNLLWGFGRWSWDSSLIKKIAIQERASLQLSLSAFSVLNHPVFGNPNYTNISSSTAGRITSSTGERTIQIGAKLSF